MSDDFFLRLERQLEAAELRELHRPSAPRRIANPRSLLSVTLAAAAVAAMVVVLASLGGAIDEENANRRPQPVGTAPAPRVEVVVTDLERGMSFGLDGRTLTVQLLRDLHDPSYERVSGAHITAICGPNAALTRRWRDDQTLMIYRFPREVSGPCRLEDVSGGIVASVEFPGVSPGAKKLITETANDWARHFAATDEICNDHTTRALCERGLGECIGDGCTPGGWAAEHRGATVRKIAISGDRAAATLASPEGLELQTIQLRRTATGEWLIHKLGPLGAVGSP